MGYLLPLALRFILHDASHLLKVSMKHANKLQVFSILLRQHD